LNFNFDANHIKSLKDKLDNTYLKFADFQTMIQSSQQRIETLYDIIKNLNVTVTNVSLNDQNITSKFVACG
jgi:hypothetical protein